MKRIVLATSNQGKVNEIKSMLRGYDVVAYTDLMPTLEIEETGTTFKANAIIKAETIYDVLNDPSSIVLSDDSGISIDALDGEPGIYSARFAGVGASDKENLQQAIDRLKALTIDYSKAHYTCAIAIASEYGMQTVHGWMHGTVTTHPKGDGGFGYDPIFIPEGYTQTLGELPTSLKETLSHRGKALELAKAIIHTL